MHGLWKLTKAELIQRLADEKTNRSFDKTRHKGQLRSFIASQFTMLSDAQDALSFDPPHIEAALQRLHMAMSAITKKLEEQ